MTAENPKARGAQRVLAHEVQCGSMEPTRLLQPKRWRPPALWGRGDLADIDAATILAGG